MLRTNLSRICSSLFMKGRTRNCKNSYNRLKNKAFSIELALPFSFWIYEESYDGLNLTTTARQSTYLPNGYSLGKSQRIVKAHCRNCIWAVASSLPDRWNQMTRGFIDTHIFDEMNPIKVPFGLHVDEPPGRGEIQLIGLR